MKKKNLNEESMPQNYLIQKRQQQKIHSQAKETQIQKMLLWPPQLLEANTRQFNF